MSIEPTAQPSRNIELKARYDYLDRAQQLCERFGAREAGILIQTDTYYRVSHGRLKLRRIEPDRAELIWYDRQNHTESRSSDYILVAVTEPQRLHLALATAMEVLITVRKRRKLLLWQNVRIHLDQVQDLGSFVEFEAVLSAGESEPVGFERVAQLCKLLSIKDEDRIGGSYSDLALASRASAP